MGKATHNGQECMKMQHKVFEYFDNGTRIPIAIGYSYINCEDKVDGEVISIIDLPSDGCNTGVVDDVYFGDHADYSFDTPTCFIKMMNTDQKIKASVFDQRAQIALKY